jgi:hypothetical protein
MHAANETRRPSTEPEPRAPRRGRVSRFGTEAGRLLPFGR